MSSRVGSIRSPNTSVTGRADENEKPRSPWTTRPSQRPYWTGYRLVQAQLGALFSDVLFPGRAPRNYRIERRSDGIPWRETHPDKCQ